MKSGPGVGDKRPQFNSSEGKAKANHKPSGAVAVPEASGSSVSVGTSTAGAPKKGSSNWDQLKQKLAVSSVSSSSAKLVTSAAPSGAEDGAARPAKKKRRIDLKKAVSIAERKDNAPVSESIEEEIAKSESFVAKSRYVGLDCEMVGIGASGKQSALARCCLIDFDGNVIFDEYVKPPGFVTDFRTKYSGIRKKDISGDHVISLQEVRRKEKFYRSSVPHNLIFVLYFYFQCQTRVAELLKGKVLVGHALKNDLDALMLKHPRSMIRDTAMYRPYQRVSEAFIALTSMFL
jgi:predicted secreted protein